VGEERASSVANLNLLFFSLLRNRLALFTDFDNGSLTGLRVAPIRAFPALALLTDAFLQNLVLVNKVGSWKDQRRIFATVSRTLAFFAAWCCGKQISITPSN
jgi:hypothetical protein